MQQQKVIWFAIVFSTVIYFVIAFVMGGNPERSFEESLRNPIVLGLYFAALSSFAVGLIVPRALPARTKMIVSLAIFESAAIFGLVAAFLQNDYRLYLAPWALAVIGFLRAWPSGEGETATHRGPV